MMNTLDLRVKRPLKDHSPSEWSNWASEAKTIADMLKSSALQDKTVALEIGIDPAILSKAQTGQARLSESHMDLLMDACGDEAWLHFWLLKRNYDPRFLHRLETDLQKENRELREKLDAIEKEREVELRLLSKIRVTT